MAKVIFFVVFCNIIFAANPQTLHQKIENVLTNIIEVFDEEYYKNTYKIDSSVNALADFLSVGLKENRNPNAWFNTSTYKHYFPHEGNSLLDWLNQGTGITDTPVFCEKKLVVSVTSHPPRIGTAFLSIESILRQKQKPNHIILYLALADFKDKKIPLSLEILKRRGLEIRFSEQNYRVATKLIPALKDFGDDYILTGDDDRLYHSTWTDRLIERSKEAPGCIVSPAARNFVIQNRLISYLAQDLKHDKQIGLGIFEGYCGVLYPPHALHENVFNFDLFKLLTPCADDVFFIVMAVLQGTNSTGIQCTYRDPLHWPTEIDGTQETGLFHEHLDANSVMLMRALTYYNKLRMFGVKLPPKLVCSSCCRSIIFPTPEHPQACYAIDGEKKGERCKKCLNNFPRTVLCIGAYDYGNIGDGLYKIILTHFLEESFNVFFISDQNRINNKGEYISMQSEEEDLSFDSLIIGGGGILSDTKIQSSIGYYIHQAQRKGAPYGFISVGLQTTIKNPTIADTRKILSLMKKDYQHAAFLSVRSVRDAHLIKSVLGEDVSQKVFTCPDLGYLAPEVFKIEHPKKEYISLIQTGNATIENLDVQDKIAQYSKQYPNARLIIMNWGGVEKPTKPSHDFAEWRLFEHAKEKYPQAIVHFGQTLSDALKQLTYPKVKTRVSDLSFDQAISYVAKSHVVITGRYHGFVLARAFNVPCDIMDSSHKLTAEIETRLDITDAKKQISMLINFLKRGSIIPLIQTDDQRNSTIVDINHRNPEKSIPYLQSKTNDELWYFMQFGTFNDNF